MCADIQTTKSYWCKFSREEKRSTNEVNCTKLYIFFQSKVLCFALFLVKNLRLDIPIICNYFFSILLSYDITS